MSVGGRGGRLAAWALAAIVLLVLLAGWRTSRRSGEESDRPTAAIAAQQHHHRAARSAVPIESAPEGRRGTREDAAPPPQAAERRMDALSEYLKSSIYPPESRPLSRQQTDLITPNQRHERLRKSSAEPAVRYRFSADAYWVTGRQPLSLWLEAYRDEQPLLAEVDEVRMTIMREDGSPGTQSTPIVLAPAEPRQQANVLQATVLLAELVEASEPLRLRFESRFRVAGQRESASFVVVYNPQDSVPARFSGAFDAEVRDGSLCIDAGVEVLVEGRYLIDANLWAGDEPVGWTRFKGELRRDSRSVPLCFFGKVLIDKGLAGPYKLAQLRGARHRPRREPDLQQMEWFEGSFETEAYPLSSFSAAEYDSPHKQRKISMLKALQQDGSGPHIFRPLP